MALEEFLINGLHLILVNCLCQVMGFSLIWHEMCPASAQGAILGPF